MSRSSNVENFFFYVQSGVTESNACILKEFPVNNSTVSVFLQCVLPCNVLSHCVGVDIIGDKAKRCRLLYGFTDLIPTQKTLDEPDRYQKVSFFFFMFK